MADESSSSKRRIVETAYDEIAESYHSWANSRPSPRTQYLDKLLTLLPETSSLVKPVQILELGCGSGIPTSQILSRDGRNLIAVDLSEAMITLARKLVVDEAPADSPKPSVDFIKSDMMDLSFPDDSFDAIVGFYSLIHLPRDDQVVLFEKMHKWLKKGTGVMLVNLTAGDLPDFTMKGWCGAKKDTDMYWSGYDAEKNREIINGKGFVILESDVVVENEDGMEVPFCWILAKKQ